MAQSVLKPCEICMGDPGNHYCLQCQQYFCGICKAQHNRQQVSRNHEFQSGENVVQEVKLRCEEHKKISRTGMRLAQNRNNEYCLLLLFISAYICMCCFYFSAAYVLMCFNFIYVLLCFVLCFYIYIYREWM